MTKGAMKHKIIFAVIVLAGGIFASCSTFSDDTDPYGTVEGVKDLSGAWKIESVTRNNIDITGAVDFSQFTLHLLADGTYRIDNYLPFVVRQNGTWGIDDPQYPFNLSFKENGQAENMTVELKYPISNGERKLFITLSPGCSSNKYVYQLIRTSK